MSKIKFKPLTDSSHIKTYTEDTPTTTADGGSTGEANSVALVTESACYCPSNSSGCRCEPQVPMSITIQDSGEHCHDDEHKHEMDKKARNKLWIASILCVIFMIGETVGGYFAGSLAIASDAAHLLTDFASFMISLFALYISERPATKRLSYGYHRAEVIGALTSVLLIWVVTGILVYMAVQRVITQEFDIDAEIMLITSGIGLVVNIIMGCTLHQHTHSHGGHGSGGHSHGDQDSKSSYRGHDDTSGSSSNRGYVNTEGAESRSHRVEEIDSSNHSSTQVEVEKPNLNVRAAFIHVIGDFLQSLGVFSAAIAIYFKPSWVIVDPICTFLFSILVLGTTYAIIRDALLVLMEGIPKGLDFNEVRETLLEVKGVCKVHNLRIWSLSMDKIAMSAHLAIDLLTAETQLPNKIILLTVWIITNFQKELVKQRFPDPKNVFGGYIFAVRDLYT